MAEQLAETAAFWTLQAMSPVVAASRKRSGVPGIELGGDQVGESGVIGGVGGMGEGRGDTDICIW